MHFSLGVNLYISVIHNTTSFHLYISLRDYMRFPNRLYSRFSIFIFTCFCCIFYIHSCLWVLYYCIYSIICHQISILVRFLWSIYITSATHLFYIPFYNQSVVLPAYIWGLAQYFHHFTKKKTYIVYRAQSKMYTSIWVIAMTPPLHGVYGV